MSRLLVLAGSIALFSQPQLLRAGTLSYVPGSVLPGSSAPWDTTTANWSNGSSSVLWPNSAGDTALFGGTGVPVVLQSGEITAGSLTFSASGYTLNSGNLTLASPGSSVITTDSGVTATISAALLNGFSKAGAGTLILSNTGGLNTGDVSVGAGTLKLGAANQIANSASATLAVGSGATFDLASFSDTFALSSTGTGTITNLSTGTAPTLTFNNSSAFSYSGNLTGNLCLSDTISSGGITLGGEHKHGPDYLQRAGH